ncbi:MAG: hypothetical protein ACLQAT_01380 [Candidatus Binataceae bacterium]
MATEAKKSEKELTTKQMKDIKGGLASAKSFESSAVESVDATVLKPVSTTNPISTK